MILQDDAAPPDDVESCMEPLEFGQSSSKGPPSGYEYTSLDNAWKTFRIVILCPGAGDQDIVCRMARVPLFRRIEYEALSYTWGPPTSSRMIYINNRSLSIRENLFSALKALRLAEHPRYLWIDALCINQEDDREKSFQLRRMKLIYQRASNVVVWLGEHENNSRLGMRLASGGPDGSDEHWLGLHHLAQREYWNRCWCIQEIVSAKKGPILVCGDDEVPLSQFHQRCVQLPSFWERAGMSSLERSIGGLSKLGISKMWAMRTDPCRSESLDLFHLLSITLSFDATDPRDRIYALIGLCGQEEQKALAPDLSLSARDVYLRVARYMSQRHLNFLAFNTNSSNTALGGRLPSWVPDWSLRDERPSTIWKEEKIFRASREKKGERFYPNVHDVGDPGVLAVEGFIVSDIVDMSEFFRPDESWLEVGSQSLRHVINSVEEMVRKFIYKHAHSAELAEAICGVTLDPEKSEVLWRTLIADRIRPHFSFDAPAPPAFAAAFCAIREELGLVSDPEHDEVQATTVMGSCGEEKPSFSTTSDRGTIPKNPISDNLQDLGLSPTSRSESRKKKRNFRVDPWSRSHYISMMRLILQDRRVFIGRDGKLGVAYKDIRVGDIVVVLIGADVPVILRPKQDGKHVQFISEAFFNGYMYGEVFKKDPTCCLFHIQ
jgi:hypothetical protein